METSTSLKKVLALKERFGKSRDLKESVMLILTFKSAYSIPLWERCRIQTRTTISA